jgi:hypothetical protein
MAQRDGRRLAEAKTATTGDKTGGVRDPARRVDDFRFVEVIVGDYLWSPNVKRFL